MEPKNESSPITIEMRDVLLPLMAYGLLKLVPIRDKNWMRLLDFIFLYLSNIRKVGETTTAQTLWTNLETLYLTKTMSNKCCLLRKFYNFMFDSSSSLEEDN